MTEKVLLLDALSDQRMYGEFEGRYVNYKPDVNSVWLNEKLTGHETPQGVETERDLHWHPFIGANGRLYVASSATGFRLMLNGKKGSRKGVTALIYASTLYNCRGLEAIGHPMTSEIFEVLPERLQNIKGEYWLANTFTNTNGKWSTRGIKAVNNGKTENIQLYCTNRGGGLYRRSMRIVVELPSDIKIDISDNCYDGSKPERALKLFL